MKTSDHGNDERFMAARLDDMREELRRVVAKNWDVSPRWIVHALGDALCQYMVRLVREQPGDRPNLLMKLAFLAAHVERAVPGEMPQSEDVLRLHAAIQVAAEAAMDVITGDPDYRNAVLRDLDELRLFVAADGRTH